MRTAVVVPHYNQSRFLGDSLRSILAQTYADFRLYLVDDCSTDDGWIKQIEPLRSDPRLVVFKTSKNVGCHRIKAKLIPQLSERFIASQDADDISHPLRLAKQMSALESGAADVIGCNAILIDADGNRQGVKKFPRIPYPWWLLGKSHIVLNPTSVVRRSVFDEIGSFDGTTSIGADTDFFHRAIRVFKVRNVPEPLYSYRQHSSSLTGSITTGIGSKTRKEYVESMTQRQKSLPLFPRKSQLRPKPIDIPFELRSV